ncbi:MAG: NADP-dependent isocitrate dehydrogenase [Mailhella sp.]|nr:NADP-dependent isocitrate dehydrogenase [Mailhella sp.]
MKHTVYWIEGDGIGPEIWNVTRPVLDAALKATTQGEHEINWVELLAGEKAVRLTGSPLPQETLDTLATASVAIKGPLGTPVGGGIRSLNVALRQTFDLYACIRPVSWFQGISTPVKHPERVNMVIFRENTEDVYAGIEYAAGTEQAEKLGAFLRDEFGANIREASAIGIKPMTEFASRRLVRRAIQYALDNGLPSVTIVHKGNIMKFTEGGFRAWGYDVAREEFGDVTIPEKEATPENSAGKVIIKDRIADAMFQEALIRPDQYSVLALPNLNGDYISDALAAQVGGLGMAPGMNMSDTLALFEATHGTAPTAAGKDIANPGSLLLSGALMLRHMGFPEAAEKVKNAILAAIAEKTVTPDLAAEMENARPVSCTEFGKILLSKVQ